MKNIAYIVVLVIALSGCRAGAPWQAWMYEGPPKQEGVEYPPLYVEGWKDGCETGVASTTNHYYKFFYDWRQDAQLAQNKVYYQGWRDAFDYCNRYMFQYMSKSFF